MIAEFHLHAISILVVKAQVKMGTAKSLEKGASTDKNLQRLPFVVLSME